MLQWEENFRKKCRKAGINWDLYGRYVDDMFLAMRPISPGWDYNSKTGKMYYSEDKARNCNLTLTKRTSAIMAMIANTIEPNIQVTVDSPEDHTDNMMPVLNLKI